LSEDARAVTEYSEEIKEELKEKGAEKVFSLGDIRLYECPLTYIEGETWEVIRLGYLIEDTKVLLYGGGWGDQPTLLYGGGWGDQPTWLVEAFEIFKSESAHHASNITGHEKRY